MEEIKALDRIVVKSQVNAVLASLDNKRRKIMAKSHSLLKINNFQKHQMKKVSKLKMKKGVTVETRGARVLIMKGQQLVSKLSIKIIT